MKKSACILLLLLSMIQYGKAQVFDVDTLVYNGDVNRYINIAVLGDGYTDAEQGKFISDATNFANYLFNDAPWSHYKKYFNIFAVKVISEGSGTTHPNTAGDCGPNIPTTFPVTYLEC